MDNQTLILIFRTGFYLSALVALLGAAAAAIIFIKGNVRRNWGIDSGRLRRHNVQQQRESLEKEVEKQEQKRQEIKRTAESVQSGPTEELPETGADTELLPETGADTEVLETGCMVLPESEQTQLLEEEFRITQQVLLIHCEDRI